MRSLSLLLLTSASLMAQVKPDPIPVAPVAHMAHPADPKSDQAVSIQAIPADLQVSILRSQATYFRLAAQLELAMRSCSQCLEAQHAVNEAMAAAKDAIRVAAEQAGCVTPLSDQFTCSIPPDPAAPAPAKAPAKATKHGKR